MPSVDAEDGVADPAAKNDGGAPPADLLEFVLGEMLSEALDLMDTLDRRTTQLKRDAVAARPDTPPGAPAARAATLRLASRLATVGGWILALQRDRARAGRADGIAGSAPGPSAADAPDGAAQTPPAEPTAADADALLDEAFGAEPPSAVMMRRSDMLARADDGALDGVGDAQGLADLAARIDQLVIRARRLDTLTHAPRRGGSPTEALSAALSTPFVLEIAAPAR